MAKYDSYTLEAQVGDETNNVTLKLSVLFEAGDNIVSVMEDVKNKLQEEALAMKESKFVKNIKQ